MNAIVAVVFVMLATVLLYAIFGAIPLWLLWNWLMPELFGLREVTLWQSFGLLFLSGLLFKSSGSSSSKS